MSISFPHFQYWMLQLDETIRAHNEVQPSYSMKYFNVILDMCVFFFNFIHVMILNFSRDATNDQTPIRLQLF